MSNEFTLDTAALDRGDHETSGHEIETAPGDWHPVDDDDLHLPDRDDEIGIAYPAWLIAAGILLALVLYTAIVVVIVQRRW